MNRELCWEGSKVGAEGKQQRRGSGVKAFSWAGLKWVTLRT